MFSPDNPTNLQNRGGRYNIFLTEHPEQNVGDGMSGT